MSEFSTCSSLVKASKDPHSHDMSLTCIWNWLSGSQFVFSTSFTPSKGTYHLTVVHCGKADFIVHRLILCDWQAFCYCAICSLLMENICRFRQENVISRVNRLQAGQFGVWIPAGARDFPVFCKMCTVVLGPTHPPIPWVLKFFPASTMVSTWSWSLTSV